MKTGAQLFTVKAYTQTERDFARTMKRIAQIGYTTVQISAVGKELSPKVIRKICDGEGLEIVLTHSDVNRVLNDTQRLIEEHDILGCKYIGLGAMPEKYRTAEWIWRFKEDFQEPVEQIKRNGKRFMYHHHDFEFHRIAGEIPRKTKEEKRIIEYLTDFFEPDEMGIILDTYWIQAAGGDVCQWIEKLKNRIPCVHLKDMDMMEKKNGAIMAPVMEGNMNFEGILKALEHSCCEYMLVEQDICQGNPFDCLKISYNNLAKAGYR